MATIFCYDDLQARNRLTNFFENALVIFYGKNSLMENNEAISLGDATIDGISKTKFMM